jgi:hypothetical protein
MRRHFEKLQQEAEARRQAKQAQRNANKPPTPQAPQPAPQASAAGPSASPTPVASPRSGFSLGDLFYGAGNRLGQWAGQGLGEKGANALGAVLGTAQGLATIPKALRYGLPLLGNTSASLGKNAVNDLGSLIGQQPFDDSSGTPIVPDDITKTRNKQRDRVLGGMTGFTEDAHQKHFDRQDEDVRAAIDSIGNDDYSSMVSEAANGGSVDKLHNTIVHAIKQKGGKFKSGSVYYLAGTGTSKGGNKFSYAIDTGTDSGKPELVKIPLSKDDSGEGKGVWHGSYDEYDAKSQSK